MVSVAFAFSLDNSSDKRFTTEELIGQKRLIVIVTNQFVSVLYVLKHNGHGIKGMEQEQCI